MPRPVLAIVHRRDLLVATIVSVGLTAVWLAILPVSSTNFTRGDPYWYLRMAADPADVGVVPFAYRILTPWAAHTLGGPTHYAAAFRTISFVALTVTGPAVYLICRRLGGGHRAALVGVVGLLSLPGWLFNLNQPYLVDQSAMALTAWSLVALVYGWFAVLPLLLSATALARETGLWLALPMYLWLRSRRLDRHVAFHVGLLFAPALLATWVVRQNVRTSVRWDSLREWFLGAMDVVNRHRIGPQTPWWVMYAFGASLGVYWVLALYGRKHGGRLWWLLLPVLGQCAFGSDWSRFAMYAFPVVIPVAAIAVWRHPRRPLLLALLAAQSTAGLADVAVNGRIMLNRPQPSLWITVGLMAVTAAVLWWPHRTKDAPQRTEADDPPQPGVYRTVSPIALSARASRGVRDLTYVAVMCEPLR